MRRRKEKRVFINPLIAVVLVAIILIPLVFLIISENKIGTSSSTTTSFDSNLNLIRSRHATPTPIQPSDKALRIASYIFLKASDSDRKLLVEKFSDETGKSPLTNLAIFMDRNPEALSLFETYMLIQLAEGQSGKSSLGVGDQLSEINDKLDDIEDRERRECNNSGGYYSSFSGCNY